MAGLAFAGHEVYERHIKSTEPQQFNFGSAPEQRAGGSVGLDQVIAAHIFGSVPVKASAALDKPKIIDAPKTQLALRLTGVVTTPNPRNSHAMIEVERGQTTVVRVGSKIGKTGARLNAVFGDHILIEHQGALEKLVIERQLLDLNSQGATSTLSDPGEGLSVAEFEALATVDPSDLDISRLLPVPEAAVPPDEGQAGDATEVGTGGEAGAAPGQPTGLQQQAEALRQRQLQQIQQQAPDDVEDQDQPEEKKFPGGLKKI